MFDKIYYINLDKRLDRNDHMTSLLKKHSLLDKAERLAATEGNKIDKNNLNNLITQKGLIDASNKYQKVYTYLTGGGIGCALSHRNVWKLVKENNLKSALVLEDDIDFDYNFYSKYQNLEKYFPKDYDVIFLGYHPSSIKYINKYINEHIVKSKRVYGLFGYVISNKGANKLLENIFPISMQLDTEISNKMDKFNIYLVVPKDNIIHSLPSERNSIWGTDIQTRIENFENIIKFNYFHVGLLILILFIIIIVFVILISFNN